MRENISVRRAAIHSIRIRHAVQLYISRRIGKSQKLLVIWGRARVNAAYIAHTVLRSLSRLESRPKSETCACVWHDRECRPKTAIRFIGCAWEGPPHRQFRNDTAEEFLVFSSVIDVFL